MALVPLPSARQAPPSRRLDPEADVAQDRKAWDIAEGHVPELDGAVDAQGLERARLVPTSMDTSRTSKMRCPTPWPPQRCCHGERADWIEALDIEEEGDHHAEVELALQHGDAATTMPIARVRVSTISTMICASQVPRSWASRLSSTFWKSTG